MGVPLVWLTHQQTKTPAERWHCSLRKVFVSVHSGTKMSFCGSSLCSARACLRSSSQPCGTGTAIGIVLARLWNTDTITPCIMFTLIATCIMFTLIATLAYICQHYILYLPIVWSFSDVSNTVHCHLLSLCVSGTSV